MYQFFNCRKGIIKRIPFSTSRQFCTFSLWRKLSWASTPSRIRQALHGRTFHNRVDLWDIIQDLSSNSLRRFHVEKRIRSNAIGLQGCYFLRRRLTPNWRQNLKKILTSHVAMMRPHNTSLQPPSTNIVFTKYPSVMDSLCNHKEMATRWADSETPDCICSALRPYLATPLHILTTSPWMETPCTSNACL